jgi:hypothetical protein
VFLNEAQYGFILVYYLVVAAKLAGKSECSVGLVRRRCEGGQLRVISLDFTSFQALIATMTLDGKPQNASPRGAPPTSDDQHYLPGRLALLSSPRSVRMPGPKRVVPLRGRGDEGLTPHQAA